MNKMGRGELKLYYFQNKFNNIDKILVSLKSYHFLPYLFIWFNLMPGVYILWTSIISNFQVKHRDLMGEDNGQ